MNRRTFLTSASTVAILGVTARAALAETTLADLTAKGAMSVATTGTNAPYTFVGPDNNLQGFDIDWVNAICKDLGVKANFVKLDWRGILPGVAAGQFDAAMSAIRITPKRQESFSFSAPYGEDEVIVVVPVSDTSITGIDDLAGKTVGVATGSIQEKIAKEKAPKAIFRSYPGLPDILLDLSAGRLDAAVVGKGGVVHAIKSSDLKIKLAGDGFAPSPLGMVFVKDNAELAGKVSDAIVKLQADGTSDAIYKKWFTV